MVVHTGIGATLREARNRRKVDLSEVEETTKIRLRYLRAIENEDWDVLPGDAYAWGFIRTYASYLGLDGDRLADEYRRSTVPAGERVPRVEPAGGSRRIRAAPRIPARVTAAIVVAGLIVALVVIGLSGGGEGGAPTPIPTPKRNGRAVGDGPQITPPKTRVALRLAATAEVWVCLLDADGHRLIDGQVLEAGAEEGPFRSRGFTVSLGNGEVTMRVDGKEAEVPATSSPIGYRIGAGGVLRKLTEAERPSCT